MSETDSLSFEIDTISLKTMALPISKKCQQKWEMN